MRQDYPHAVVQGLWFVQVRTGHGKPGKSWKFRISFSTPRKSWKMMLIKGNGKNVVEMKMISKKMVKFRSWKTWRSHGKDHGKSWNFKSSKTMNPGHTP